MKASIIVQNLKCGGCAKTIINKLSELPNISNVEVDNDTSQVSFNYTSNNDSLVVTQRLKGLGYPSVEENNSAITKAKSFVSCASGKISNT